MAVNWNEPTNNTTMINVLSIQNEKIQNAAKMDYGSDTNLPSGAIRYNTTDKVFESWNGSVWSGIQIFFPSSVAIGRSSAASTLHIEGAGESEGSAYGQVIVKSSAAYNATPRPGIIFQIKSDSSNTEAYTASIYAEKLNTTSGDRRTTLNFATRASSGTTARRWQMDNSGNFIQDSTNGGSIRLSKASTIVVSGLAATGIAAAGTIRTDATALTAVFNNVTSVASGTGVSLWDAPDFSRIEVRNAGANALKVYPPSGSQTMNGGTGGAAVEIAAGSLGVFRRIGDDWIATEHAVAAA